MDGKKYRFELREEFAKETNYIAHRYPWAYAAWLEAKLEYHQSRLPTMGEIMLIIDTTVGCASNGKTMWKYNTRDAATAIRSLMERSEG